METIEEWKLRGKITVVEDMQDRSEDPAFKAHFEETIAWLKKVGLPKHLKHLEEELMKS